MPNIDCALISTDREFLLKAGTLLENLEEGLTIAMRLEASFTEIDDRQLGQLRSLDPDLILLDLESDPRVGLKFAQYLIEEKPSRIVFAAGPTDRPDLLLSAMQAGVSEYLPRPFTAEQVRGALDRSWRKSGKSSGSKRKPGRLIAVFNAKGGSGSTTLCTNLAIEIHRLSRRRTLLVDLDLELGETALQLGVRPQFSVIDLIRNFHRVDAGLLASYIERHESGIELLSAPYEPADFESVEGTQIGPVLRFLRSHYEFVVVDLPKSLNPVTLGAFEESDELYLVTVGDLPSIRNLTRCLPLLTKLAEERPEGWMRLVVNRYDPRQVISIQEIEKTLGVPVHWTLRNDYRVVMDSINEGKPAVLARRSEYARDVRGLAAEITGVSATPGKDRGIFGSLFAPFRSSNGQRRDAPAPSRSKS